MKLPAALLCSALALAPLLPGCGRPQGNAPAPPATGSQKAHAPDPAEPPAQLVVPELAEFERPNAVLLAGRVFPLGWSPSDLFAYVYEPPDEACGCYVFHLVVQDLATNQPVWEHRHDSGPIREGDTEQLTSLQAVWRAQGAVLSAKLRELGIVRRAEPALHAFSSAGLQIRLHTTQAGEDSRFGFDYVTSYRVELVSPRGAQEIFRGGPAEASGGADASGLGPEEVSSPGYLQSPYEARVAVLIQETWRGWEGPPQVAKLRFAGADLDDARARQRAAGAAP